MYDEKYGGVGKLDVLCYKSDRRLILNNLFPFPLIRRGGIEIKIGPNARILSLGLDLKHIEYAKKN